MSPKSGSKAARPKRAIFRRLRTAGIWLAALTLILLCVTAWLGSKATSAKSDLEAASALLPTLRTAIAANDASKANETVGKLAEHTAAAREATSDPVWQAASAIPLLGPNMSAANEVATSADDVARLGAVPLVRAFESLNWQSLTPSSNGMDLLPLKSAEPQVQSAAYAVRESLQRLNNIRTENLLPQVAKPLVEAREKLQSLQTDLDSAADAASLAPNMLGADTPRRYLLLVQNNAESRATGGIPGALAVLTVDKGKLKLEAQTSAAALGTFVPPIAVDTEQQAIYSARVGKFMQDVNLTPDFPTTANTAREMWKKSTGEQLDGVLSLDPVALSFILEATGPVQITDPAVREIGRDLPSQLTSKNVVQTLLSDVYTKIERPQLQDVYFAGAAKEIFESLSAGKTDPKKLLDALARGEQERRILLWSAQPEEQSIIGRHPLGGMVSGASVAPSQFGVYFNDGTGAKMDYWVKRTVQIIKDCTRDGYREVSLKVTSTNTAPADAATSLPAYVTGDGTFGVPAGTVQTNVVAYGPAQSNIDTVVKDGQKIPFAAQRHGQRSVGTSTMKLAPGETSSLEFNFGRIVQQAKPEIVVTPTTQAVNEMILQPTTPSCE